MKTGPRAHYQPGGAAARLRGVPGQGLSALIVSGLTRAGAVTFLPSGGETVPDGNITGGEYYVRRSFGKHLRYDETFKSCYISQDRKQQPKEKGLNSPQQQTQVPGSRAPRVRRSCCNKLPRNFLEVSNTPNLSAIGFFVFG
ncbi:hypothetical protein RRG08_054740 [Elysia crispata]|uniref:Uncharacterized protein n=1 Tax=Elysia crispata TaxID=231223 RepID=A0AAE1B105_9GAST|nr:hypothetical protein RRG08_054740 [Elysia crispata]